MSQTPLLPGPLDDQPPRWRHDSWPREILAWIVILASSATIIAATAYRYHHAARDSDTQPSETRVTQLTIIAKYAVGARDILRAASAGQAQQTLQQMTSQMDDVARAPTEHLRVAMVTGEMLDGKTALERIRALEPTVTTDAARQDIAALTQIYSTGPDSLDPAEAQRLVQRYGWFGHLAVGFKPNTSAPDNSDRQIALSTVRRVAIALIAAVVIAGTVFAVGFVLMILLLVFLLDGKLTRRFVPTPGPSRPFLEAFAIYLGGFLLISLIARFAAPKLLEHIGVYYLLLALPPALAIAWPRWCGVPVQQWKQGLGWHTGRGIFKEIGLGITGYIAGFPFLALMFWITTFLIKLAHAQPDHPVIHQLTGSRGMLVEVFILACVFAPIVEETMFRGALFNYLRSGYAWLPSALVTSLIFAAIHPQGWTLIPMLGGIAMVLAAIREWRGTILASAAAHALNNGAVLLLAVTFLR